MRAGAGACNQGKGQVEGGGGQRRWHEGGGTHDDHWSLPRLAAGVVWVLRARGEMYDDHASND